MFTVLSILVILVAGWTSFALLNQSNNKEEITGLLQSMLTNAKDFSSNTGKLLLTLFRDTLQRSSLKIDNPKEIFSKITDSSSKDDSRQINKSVETTENLFEKDEAISGFSPEVVQTITEEEEKAA